MQNNDAKVIVRRSGIVEVDEIIVGRVEKVGTRDGWVAIDAHGKTLNAWGKRASAVSQLVGEYAKAYAAAKAEREAAEAAEAAQRQAEAEEFGRELDAHLAASAPLHHAEGARVEVRLRDGSTAPGTVVGENRLSNCVIRVALDNGDVVFPYYELVTPLEEEAPAEEATELEAQLADLAAGKGITIDALTSFERAEHERELAAERELRELVRDGRAIRAGLRARMLEAGDLMELKELEARHEANLAAEATVDPEGAEERAAERQAAKGLRAARGHELAEATQREAEEAPEERLEDWAVATAANYGDEARAALVGAIADGDLELVRKALRAAERRALVADEAKLSPQRAELRLGRLRSARASWLQLAEEAEREGRDGAHARTKAAEDDDRIAALEAIIAAAE